MIKTITEIGYLPDVALVTVNNIPNTPQNLSKIMNEISDRHVTVDMICRTAPYKDKFTLFSSAEDFQDSENNGFLPLGANLYKVRINGEVNDYDLSEDNTLDKDIETIIITVKNEYGYLL